MEPTMLPGRYFVCPEVFHREAELIFGCSWLVVAHRSQLKERGDCLITTIEGCDLILVHAGDRVRCFHNTCRHRGARLVSRPSGALTNHCFVCPYHAWKYNDRGELVSAPNMHNAEGFDPAQQALQEVPCASWLGFVLVSLETSVFHLGEDYAALANHFAPWQMESLLCAATLDYDVAANWKLLMQNYSECYHCPTVHPALNRLTSYRSASNDLIYGRCLGGPMELNDGCETMSVNGKEVGATISTLSAVQRRQVYYYVLFPNLLLSLHPDYVMAHRLRRIAVDRTLVTCQFYFSPDALEQEDFSADRAVEFWDEVNRQDWHVCELSQQGISSPAYQPGPYSPFEKMLATFDDYYLKALGEK